MHAVHEPSALQSKVSASLKLVTESREKGLKAWQKAAVAAAVTALFGLGIFQSELPTEMAGWLGSLSTTSAAVETPVEADATEVTKPETMTPETVTDIAVETPAPVSKVVTQPTKGMGYYIVVGSFKEALNAEVLSEEIAAKGYNVSVLPGSLKKVGIGHFASRAAAKAELAKIKSEVNSHAWIFAY